MAGRLKFPQLIITLLNPHSRGKISEWVYHQFEKEEGLISLNFDFVDVTINGDHIGIYTLEEHFRKHVIERNRHIEGIIFKPVVPLKIFNLNQILSNYNKKNCYQLKIKNLI